MQTGHFIAVCHKFCLEYPVNDRGSLVLGSNISARPAADCTPSDIPCLLLRCCNSCFQVLVIADEQASPVFIAADLLSQAEHGPDSQVGRPTKGDLHRHIRSLLHALYQAGLHRFGPAGPALEHGPASRVGRHHTGCSVFEEKVVDTSTYNAVFIATDWLSQQGGSHKAQVRSLRSVGRMYKSGFGGHIGNMRACIWHHA